MVRGGPRALGGHSRGVGPGQVPPARVLGDAHDRSGEKVRARHSFLEAVGIARTLQDPALMSMAEAALGRSPWPVPLDKPGLEDPVGVQNQHPFLMPEAPPAKLLPMGEMLAGDPGSGGAGEAGQDVGPTVDSRIGRRAGDGGRRPYVQVAAHAGATVRRA